MPSSSVQMTAKKPAGCPHRTIRLIAYVANELRKRGHSVLWCLDCGALCVRDDFGPLRDAVWQVPRRLSVAEPKRPAKGKRPGG